MTDTLTLDQLKQNFTGEVILPEDQWYEEARSAFMKEGSPAIVVRPKSPQDIVAAITFAKQNSLILSIRSGGHSSPGFGTNDNGLVIDLCHLNIVEVLDQQKGLVRVGSGAHWGDVAQQLNQFGLAISSGDTKSVGVGGLTLGGGIGWMVRKYGLTIDTMKAAEIVTADGSILKLSEHENADLFWAIRGGGGNFGVVTYFEFEAHPIKKVYTATIVYGLEDLHKLLTGWRNHMRTATEDLTSNFMVMPKFMENPANMTIMCCFAGEDEAAANAAFEPLLQLGTVVKKDIQLKEYSDALDDAHKPGGIKIISKSALIKDFNDDCIKLLAESYGKVGDPILMIRSLKGALNRVPKDATAFAHRDSEALIASVAFVPVDAPETAGAASLELWKKIEPFTSGAYCNFLYESNEADVAIAYPTETYKRLSQLKQKYDPTNLFNQNYNIKPAST